jgi:arsenate reductase-like glutaredoxin family protein
MRKKDISLILSLVIALSSATVYAEVSAPTTGTNPPVSPIRKEINDAQRDVRMKAMQDKKDIMQNGKDAREDIKADSKAKMEALKASGAKPGEMKADMKDVRMDRKEDLMKNAKDTKEALMENREKKIEALKENQEKFKTEMEARKKQMADKILKDKKTSTDKKVKLAEDAKARVKEELKKIFNRLDARVNNLVSVDGKLATRLNEVTQTGTDTTSIASQLKIAQDALTKAKTDVAAAKALAETEVGSTTTKGTFTGLVKTAEQSVQGAVAEYKKTVEMLRPNRDDNRPAQATTTQQ